MQFIQWQFRIAAEPGLCHFEFPLHPFAKSHPVMKAATSCILRSKPTASYHHADMIFVTSSTSSASVKYFWIFECWSSSDDPLGGAGNSLSSIYFLIFVQLCKWSLYICKEQNYRIVNQFEEEVLPHRCSCQNFLYFRFNIFMLFALILWEHSSYLLHRSLIWTLYIGLNASMQKEIWTQVLNWQLFQDSSEFRAFR